MEKLTICPLCGHPHLVPFLSTKDHSFTQQTFNLDQCAKCGFVLTNPRPTTSDIGTYYESPDYISHSNTTQGIQARLYQYARRRAIEGKHKAIARTHRTGRLLDYGCGTGEFLAYMQRAGYTTTGIEPSPHARTQARTNHQLHVEERFEALGTDPFDIITMWHVLEHVHNLYERSMQLSERLPPGGLLVIAVPDRESWDAQHYGAEWAAYDVPRHLWHFRRKDITQLIARTGLTLEHIAPMWFDAPYIAMHSERFRGAGPITALIKGMALGAWSNMVAAITSRPTSSSLFFARKR